MALLKQSIQVYSKLGEFFAKLREGQAPEKFTRGFLVDLGFRSSNWHASIALLKGLGLLSADGSPTSHYMEFLDKTRWRNVLGAAVRDAYSDIFVMKREPKRSDLQMISGKYKSTYNMSEVAAERAARTFLALLDLSDKDVVLKAEPEKEAPQPESAPEQGQTLAPPEPGGAVPPTIPVGDVGLHYNIQIHLPATKDVAVYNAIFRSLKEHLID